MLAATIAGDGRRACKGFVQEAPVFGIQGKVKYPQVVCVVLALAPGEHRR